MKYYNQKIGIIGLGYVGMPLTYLSAVKGFDVVGIDKNLDTVKLINERKNVPSQLKKMLNNKKKLTLIATNDYKLLSDRDIIIICVPTPTKNNVPDLTILNSVMIELAKYIKKGCLLIIESTIAPGMTKKYVEDYLLNNANLKVNIDYDLAYCPERIDTGNKKYWVGNINRVCGSSSKEALQKTYNFYNKIIDAKIITMNSIEEAELVKVWENSMRNINIAQANLLAVLCDKYNFSISKLIEGLNSKIEQFGLSLAYPGLGPGGHCIPEDIHYLIDTVEKNAKIDMQMLKESVKINENMPQYAYDKLKNIVKNKKYDLSKMNVLMLGLSYKANTADVRRSQAKVLYDIITNDNNKVTILDPFVNNYNSEVGINFILEKKLNKADIVIISCPHDIFLKVDYSKYKNIKFILDCWNKLDIENVCDSKFVYIGIGK